jgi:hypothetical protein
VQPTIGIERVPEREEIRFVRAAAVMQDEEPCRLAAGRALAEDERGHALSPRR